MGILGHKGIILIENDEIYIYHNTPINGFAIKESLDQFILAGREIKKVSLSNLTAEEIKIRFSEVNHKKFNWISWNCNHFVNYLLYKEKYSPKQKAIFILSAIAGFAAIKYIKR